MEERGLKVHVLMNRDFVRSAEKQPGEGAMPAPRAPLLIPESVAHDSPAIDLLPGLLSYYPLKLRDILLREQLRAHFDFRCTDYAYPLPTNFTRAELDVRERELIAYADEPVSAWNLMQVRTAKILIDMAPKNGRAVSLEMLGAFHKSPQQFYVALTAPESNLQ